MTRQSSLLRKITVSTSIAITLLLAAAGYFVQAQARAALYQDLEGNLRGTFRAYESLWRARADELGKVSLVLSNMQYVRAAFQTNDRATIQDTAAEIWQKISDSNDAVFLVTDPRGEVIASLGGARGMRRAVDAVRDAMPHFPKQKQAEGFSAQDNGLYELVITPVYVQGAAGPALIDVLVAGFPVNQALAADLRERTGGSDFVFLEGGHAIASTLDSAATRGIEAQYRRVPGVQQVSLPNRQYAVLGTTLLDLAGAPAGDLLILRDFDGIKQDIASLEFKLLLIAAAAVLAGIGISSLLARRILKPIRQLDQAAALIAEQKYETRVPEADNDELGRLARTFNAMSRSIQDAREELIRQERISTIGRLSSSIVHDLRNPLAAIYGGAEMMMDGELSPEQLKRLAGNIYRSSRAIKDMLQELVDVSRGRIQAPETCRLSEVIGAAVEAQAPAAEQNRVEIQMTIDPSIELPVEPARMERVFLNLIGNAIEAMPEGGRIDIAAERGDHTVVVRVDDTGPGVPPSVRQRLFQPFVTSGKNGLGLGLALSRQTVLDHGGDLWIENESRTGAHFRLKLPVG